MLSRKYCTGHLLSRWFLARLILWPWRWRRHVPSKRQLTFNKLCGVVSQKNSSESAKFLSYHIPPAPMERHLQSVMSPSSVCEAAGSDHWYSTDPYACPLQQPIIPIHRPKPPSYSWLSPWDGSPSRWNKKSQRTIPRTELPREIHKENHLAEKTEKAWL
jgi:hypothetical protein